MTQSSTRPVVAAYYPEERRASGYPAARIPAPLLTHVIYAFLRLTEERDPATGRARYRGVLNDEAAARANLNELRELKRQNPHLKVTLSIGGWGVSSTWFSNASADDETCAAFVASMVGLLDEFGLDGLDMDWEYPVHGGEEVLPPPQGTNYHRPEDRDRFTRLLAECRRQLGPDRILSAALPAPLDLLDLYDLEAAAPLLDYVMLMTYDLHNGWETRGPTNFHTALRAVPGDPSPTPLARETLNIHSAVEHCLRVFRPEQVVLGTAFYGRGWRGVPAGETHGLFQPAEGLCEPGGGTPTYARIAAELEPAMEKHTHPVAQTNWVYGPRDGGTFVGYDDPETLQAKAAYAAERGLGGVMFWELTGDIPDRHPLLHGLRRGLGLE
ncbi:MAG TPA: glycosyl hydrolase family 18 protein [Deinococcales bacterium]|nr:glycosyl hydrolase family 18 protein [Deinococcales bacterium]